MKYNIVNVFLKVDRNFTASPSKIRGFIGNSFKEHNLDARYAITYGRVADVDVVDVAESLKTSGKLLSSTDCILNKDYPKQFVFHTNEAVSYIKKYMYTNI